MPLAPGAPGASLRAHVPRAALALVLSLHAGVVWAQDRNAWAFVVDNDHFNFWQPEHERPDVEYTQGLDLSVSLPASHGPFRGRQAANGLCPTRSRCVRWRLGLRHEIYTPSLDAPPLQPGLRPYAGWLAAHVGLERELARRSDQLRLTVGVTGEPSLAEGIQKGVHALFGYAAPVGWERQLPFEPGVLVEYRAAREVLTLTPGGSTGLRMAGITGAHVGTVGLGATAGAGVTLGVNPAKPWQGSVWRPTERLALYLLGGARLDAVLRNAFLQGTLFRESGRVDIRRLVAQYDLGLALRYGRAVLEWRAIHRTREYRTQPEGHTYSSIALALLP